MAKEEGRFGNCEDFIGKVHIEPATDEADPVVTPSGEVLFPYKIEGDLEAKIDYLRHIELDHGVGVHLEAPPGSVYIDRKSTSRSFGMPRNWSGSNWNPKGPIPPWGTTSSSSETIH